MSACMHRDLLMIIYERHCGSWAADIHAAILILFLPWLRSFAELSKVLEPGKAAKTDKSSIITDAIRVVTQLRAENGQLRQLNKFLEVTTTPFPATFFWFYY